MTELEKLRAIVDSYRAHVHCLQIHIIGDSGAELETLNKDLYNDIVDIGKMRDYADKELLKYAERNET